MFFKQSQNRPPRVHSIVPAACARTLFALFCLGKLPSSHAAPSQFWLSPVHAQKTAASSVRPIRTTVDLNAAIQQGMVQGHFRGNGKELLRMSLVNKSAQELLVSTAEGRVFKSGSNSVVVVRSVLVELSPGVKMDQDLQTAALFSSNKIQPGTYSVTPEHPSRLDGLLAYLQDHPETPPGAIQTAILALTENLPLSTFAKFSQPGTDLPSQAASKSFKADTSDIILALTILRELGFQDSQIALTIDPQLKIEAMIDPMAHAAAMRYYGIKYDQEWLFWKGELLKGNPGTRHYALHGIARYYPEVAIQMLPQWAREPRTEPVYRVAAIQALCETQRIEAVSVLRQLQQEFGQTELGQTAKTAAEVLQKTLDHQAQCVVAFRTSGSLPRIQNLVESLEESIQKPAEKKNTEAAQPQPSPSLAVTVK